MALAKRHPVTLLAPSGREQPVALVVARDGVRLTTVEGKGINTFAFETIRKWLPSHLRSKNPGPDDCLDLQIETDKGPRDLRMRCASPLAVKQLMKDLRDTVETIMREMDDQQIQQQEHGRRSAAVQEAPSLSAALPTTPLPAAGPGGYQPESPSRSNAETQTLRDLEPAEQKQQQQQTDSGASQGSGARGLQGSPLLVHAPAGGVAQLFVAHPTGIALPVGSRGVPTPALMEGLQQATATIPVVPASGTFAYEYLDAYGLTTSGTDGGELEVTDRVSSAAPAFFNAMFHQARAGLPGYGAPPPPSPPLSPAGQTGSLGTNGGGGYYAQPYEAHQQYAGQPPLPPQLPSQPPLQQQQPPQYLAPAAPQTYYSAPTAPPQQTLAQAPQAYQPAHQQQYQPAQQQQYQPTHQQQYQAAPQQTYQSAPQQQYPPQQAYEPAPPPQQPYQPPPTRGFSQRERPGPSRLAGARPARRSDPDPVGSPVRRRVEFSGIDGRRLDAHSEDGEGVGSKYMRRYQNPHYEPGREDSAGSGDRTDSEGGSEQSADGDPTQAAERGGGADGDLQLQVRFLEDLVARLSAEVSRRAVSPERAAAAAMALAGAGDASPQPAAALPQPAAALPLAAAASPPAAVMMTPSAPPAAPAVDYEALLNADALGAAAVLRDQKLLAPLLGAYDTRIEQLESDLRTRTEQLQALKDQVDEVVEENDRLRADLAVATEQRNAAQAAASTAAAAVAAANDAAAAAAAAGAGSSEELELLRRENELLVKQQSELDAEIQRLHRQLQERAQEALRATQEQATLMSQAQQAAAKAQEADGRNAKLTEALRGLEAKAAALAAQSAGHKASAEEAAAEAARSKAALEELRLQHAQLQAEAAAAQQRYKVAADGAASLQLELSTQRERSDALQGQVSALTRECDTLRSALGGVETKLTELQRRDADVWSRVKEAMSASEEARLARDGALARCTDLERQVDIANTRLATVRQATRDAVADEFNGQIIAAQVAAAQVRDELAAAHAAVSEWRARAERLERDQASLTAELAALREDTAAALASKSRLGLASLGAMEKVTALERERDEAVARLESAQRKAERAARDAQMERQSTEHTIRGLKSTIAELEANLGVARAEAGTARRQAEAVGRELASVKAARQQAEAELRQQIAAARSEREGEVRAMAAKMEAQAAAAAAAATEAERLLNSKQELLARWREEAQTLASRMEAALSDHKREIAARGHEVAELRARCETVAAENVELQAAVSDLEAKVDDLHGQLSEAEARADAAAAQVVAASNRETGLQGELRQLQMMLDRTHFEKSRIQRANDPLTARYDALKKDIRQATAAPSAAGAAAVAQHSYAHAGNDGAGYGNGWAGSPDGVVHAARVPRVGGVGYQQPGVSTGR